MSSDQLTDALTIDQGVSLAPVLTQYPEWLHVALVGDCKRYSLRIKNDNVATVMSGIIELPPKIGASSYSEDQKIFCLGPDEWMIICSDENASSLKNKLDQVSSDAPFSLVDISHRNVAFTASGSLAANVISAGCPLDLSLKTFPIGKSTRTVFERTEIVLLREGETQFYVECWRSFAPYLCSYFERVVVGYEKDYIPPKPEDETS